MCKARHIPAVPRFCVWYRGQLAIMMLLTCWIGCRQTPQARFEQRPARHSIRANQLLLLSDFQIPKRHPLLIDLERLQVEIRTTLGLPQQRDDVVVYLFGDQEAYRRFLDATYPKLPGRRAYFVGTSYELAVYTFWGERVQEDLRHEYTHGVLHACLNHVPLWLDEGLAEYFEVPRSGQPRPDYARQLSQSLEGGWRPDLKRLELLSDFSQMRRIDYQEAWAWVHFMLHASPDTREVLIGYLHDLRQSALAESLHQRLKRVHPEIEHRMLAYLTTLNTTLHVSQARGNQARGNQAGGN